MRPVPVALALVLALALVAGCASPARESTGGAGGGADTSARCSGASCQTTIQVVDNRSATNRTNST